MTTSGGTTGILLHGQYVEQHGEEVADASAQDEQVPQGVVVRQFPPGIKGDPGRVRAPAYEEP